MYPRLFSPLQLGAIELKNRIVMAAMTRARSPSTVPNAANATYYAQRAGAGLIITEATQVSIQGRGAWATPGIHTPEQIAGWRRVTDAVHAAGGKIFCQLQHSGRVSHTFYQEDGRPPVSSSAVKGAVKTFIDTGFVDTPAPRALGIEEIPGVVEQYRAGALNAIAAGFDGVEIHGANGYLLDQFLQDGSNQRTDPYGGSIENRIRLLMEVVGAVMGVWGEGRVGVRLSPYGTYNDMHDSDPLALFTHVIRSLDNRGLAYLHLIEPRASLASEKDGAMEGAPHSAGLFRRLFRGPFISAGGHTPESAQAIIESGLADAVAFGRLFIANPDLPERVRRGAVLNRYDRTTFYGGDANGYTDYPSLADSHAAPAEAMNGTEPLEAVV